MDPRKNRAAAPTKQVPRHATASNHGQRPLRGGCMFHKHCNDAAAVQHVDDHIAHRTPPAKGSERAQVMSDHDAASKKRGLSTGGASSCGAHCHYKDKSLSNEQALLAVKQEIGQLEQEILEKDKQINDLKQQAALHETANMTINGIYRNNLADQEHKYGKIVEVLREEILQKNERINKVETENANQMQAFYELEERYQLESAELQELNKWVGAAPVQRAGRQPVFRRPVDDHLPDPLSADKRQRGPP